MTNQGRTLALGDTIGGRYLLEAVLGEGGMALVYRARHLGTGRQCALKVIHPHLITRPQLIELFIREAQVGARIGQSPHIVDVFDAGADEARRVPFLAMELLQGEDLDSYCEKRGPMPSALVGTVFEQLGAALDQAHRAGIVHRDLKPSNLFLTTSHKGEPMLKVVDFGIAKALEGEQSRTATQVGTPAYAAPEQFGPTFRELAARQGIIIPSTVSPATDVWALGLIAFDLLTGSPAGHYWGADTVAELPLKVSIGQFEAPSHRAGPRAGLLPPGFDAWFARCVQRNALERWQSAGQATGELVRLLRGAAPGYAPPSLPAPASYAATHLAPPPSSPQGPGGYPLPGVAAPVGYAPAGMFGPPPPIATGSTGAPWGAVPATTGAVAAGTLSSPGGSLRSPGAATAPRERGGLIAGVVAVLALAVIVPVARAAFHASSVRAAVKSCEGDKSRCDEACDADDLVSCVHLGELAQGGETVATDAARAVSLYQKACDGKEYSGCARLAYMRLHGLGGKDRDPAEAMRLSTVACDGKNQLGCTLLGEILRDAPGTVNRDEARGRPLFQTACDAGEPRGCVDLGVLFMEGRAGVAQDDAQAVALFQKTCDGPVTIGCSYLARMTVEGRGKLAKDAARGAAIAQRACDEGDLWSCEAYALMLSRGQGGLAKDEVKATALFQRTCDLGGDWACVDLADMYEAGAGGLAKDVTKAAALYRVGCDASAGKACAFLAYDYMDGKGGLDKSVPQALSLLRRACDNGYANGCHDAGVLLYNSEPPIKDEVAAIGFDRKACDLGSAAACSDLGAMYAMGRGGLEKDQVQATTFYKRACEAGAAMGCSNLAFKYAAGEGGVPKDASAARALFKKACTLGDGRGCFLHGIYCEDGTGGPSSTAEAMPSFKTACDAGFTDGCGALGYYLLKGIVVARDRDKGIELLKRGCAGGHKWSCGKLKQAGVRVQP